MNQFINYLVEANGALICVLLSYYLLLRSETDFRFARVFMLMGILLSLTIPLIHMDSPIAQQAVPSLSSTLPTYWLPTIPVGESAETEDSTKGLLIWGTLETIYWTGVVASLTLFLIRLFTLFMQFRSRISSTYDGVRIIETDEQLPTFSFFRTVFIGNAKALSQEEKTQIVNHEKTHASQLHSIDIMITQLMQVIFWFNPLVYAFRKIFVQLHEFEADARAVENQDVDRYCNLLARVALQNAGLSLGNHFNHSLTIKRIQMMRTIKSNIHWSKAAAGCVILFLIFSAVACQDQINEQQSKVPADVRERYEAFKKSHTGHTFLVEYDAASEKELRELAELEAQFGNPSHIENFSVTIDNNIREFTMIQFKGDQQDVVNEMDELPQFQGGYEALHTFLLDNIRYPEGAQKASKGGTVYVEFIVTQEGKVTNANVKKGVDAEIDAEALRVVQSFPSWTPGKLKGENVTGRLVLPIKFDPQFSSK